MSDDPIPDGAHAAVVDRVVEGEAVLLVGDDETEVHVPADGLPDGTGEGAWLAITVEGGAVLSMTLDSDRTDAAGDRIAQKLDRLRRDRRGGRFDS